LPSLQEVPGGALPQVPVAVEQTEHVPQAEPVFCQAPLGSQVWGWAPLQDFAPGLHTPEHWPLPALHTFGHTLPVFCQTPFESQVCGWRPVHFLVPGVHTPAHVPLAAAHTYAQAAPTLFMVPVASHCWG
jgi:hypothetical protein